MDNAFYIYESIIDKEYPGVKKKIIQQNRVIESQYRSSILCVNPISGRRIRKRIFLHETLFDWETVYKNIQDPKLVYIRKLYCDFAFIEFLKKLKKNYSKVKIVIEVPTYPYDKEQFSSLKQLPIYIKDKYFREKIYKYVDRIVTYTNDNEIFHVQTVKIQNGIDIEQFPVIVPRDRDDEIHLLAVAALQSYHGYERVIIGLKNYYAHGGQRDVMFYIVGTGPEEKKLRAIVKKERLENRVIFFGKKIGDELTEICNKADIGMGSFGFYKIGLEIASSLKLREYLARGLPIIGGSKQDLFSEETFPYYLEFSNDNTPLDIEKIVNFYDSVYNSSEKQETVIMNIRKYAEENVTWEKTFEPVMDYVRSSL